MLNQGKMIKHEFAKQLLQYCLIKLLNEDENASQIAYKVGEQPFCTFKSVIISYREGEKG